MIQLDTRQLMYVAEEHRRSLQAQAENERMVRAIRGPRPLRRQVGRLLIAAGSALSGQALETADDLPCRDGVIA